MELRRIKTEKDIEIVESLFYKIFPDESGYDLHHFKNSITGRHTYKRLEYYLAYEKDTPVGLTGIYANKDDECWLGWFGIFPLYRRKGYATQMLDLQMKLMKEYGYKVCRIYTNTISNELAVRLYSKAGFQENAKYNHVIIMAKALDGKTPVSKWQGKPLGYVPEWPI